MYSPIATPGPFTLAQAIASGLTPTDVARAVRQGLWIRMRWRVFVTAEDYAEAAAHPARLEALRVRCLLLALSRKRIAAAGLSAARIHGLELLGHPSTELVVCTADTGVKPTRRDGYCLRAAHLPAEQVVRRYQTPVTSIGRTLLDLVTNLDFVSAVVATESALRQGLIVPARFDALLATAAGRPEVNKARKVFAFADGRTETVLESVSRVTMSQLDIPMPTPQTVLYVAGREIRVDFDWAPDLDLVGEADGLEKYLPNGGTDRAATLRAVQDEKDRERRILTVRREIVRWGWREANDPRLLAAILLPAIARAQARHTEAS